MEDGAAGVAAVDAGVGLEEGPVAQGAAGDERAGGLAAGGGDDAGGGGDLIAERVAEDDDPLAGGELIGVAEAEALEAGRLDGEIDVTYFRNGGVLETVTFPPSPSFPAGVQTAARLSADGSEVWLAIDDDARAFADCLAGE